MRLLSLDYAPVFGDEADTGIQTFGSDTSAFDYDIVLWDPARTFRRYWRAGSDGSYNGVPALDEDESAAWRSDVARRRAEFTDFLAAGRTLVVAISPPQIAQVRNGQFSTTGTGRNQKRIHKVETLDLLSTLPVEIPALQRARGDRISPAGEGPIARLLKKYVSSLEYTAVIDLPQGSEAVARVTGTDRVVAAVLPTAQGGHLVLLPRVTFEPLETSEDPEENDDVAPNWLDDDDDPDADYTLDYPDEAEQFQKDLIEAVVSLSGQGEIARPSWAADYATENQRLARAKVVKEMEVVERGRLRLAKAQAESEAAQQLDQLFLGTGRQLELRVRDVLEILGCDVSEPEPGRADWTASIDGQQAVIEVKGVSKSAAERNAAQLEKWVAASFEDSGRSPKGILVANTWRETPLIERTGADFPDQMIPYSTARGHCLVTGLQLFVIACEVLSDASRKAFWRKQLLGTSGLLQGVPDWQAVLEHSTSQG